MLALRRAAIRAAPLAVRPAVRPFSVFGARLSGAVSKEHAETSFGSGSAAGQIPTDVEQSTGLERAELLSKLEGKELFDVEPLNMTHLGTVKNPIIVKSHDPIRFVGCTGYPVDSHDTIWINANKDHEHDRCYECGSVFKLEYVGTEDDHHH